MNIEKHSEKWRDFEREIEGKAGTGGGGAGTSGGDSDEELVMVQTQAQLAGFKNQRCPMTSVEITELEEPVKDKMGYIYEKKAILKYLQGGRYNTGNGVRRCPVGGTQHTLCAQDLQLAMMQIRAYKRRARLTQSQAQNEGDVLDL